MWWRRAVLPSLPWVVCFLSFFLFRRPPLVGLSVFFLFVAPAASTGRVLDVLYLMRRLWVVSPMVPPPSAWATSGVPLLREAIEFIEMLVNDSAGFKEGPGDDDDDWKFIRGKIVGDDGSVNYAGIEMVSGHHFQHVANDALQQDMFDAVVNDSTRLLVPSPVQRRSGRLPPRPPGPPRVLELCLSTASAMAAPPWGVA